MFEVEAVINYIFVKEIFTVENGNKPLNWLVIQYTAPLLRGNLVTLVIV